MVERTRISGLWCGCRRASADRMELAAVAQIVTVPKVYTPAMKGKLAILKKMR